MTVEELRRVLERYDDNDEVVVRLEHDNHPIIGLRFQTSDSTILAIVADHTEVLA